MIEKKSKAVVVANKPMTTQGLNPEQIDLVKRTVAVGASDDELKLFLYAADRSGLDPLTRQIHFVKRAGKGTIQVGIDGYRAIAARTGELAGIEDAIYDSEEGDRPKKATVTVYRTVKGMRVGFTASARWTEYCPQSGQDFMWKKMPYLMLAKVAESLALRKAFPADLTGIYTNEEMAQAAPLEGEYEIVHTDDVEDVVSSGDDLGMSMQEKKDTVKELLSAKEMGMLKTVGEYKEACERLTGLELIPENYDAIITKLKVTK